MSNQTAVDAPTFSAGTATAVAPRPVTGYDPEVRFYATRYTQGGRVVYSLDLSLSQIAGLLPAPDPAVVQPGNRRVVPSHANGFANYVRDHSNWISPAIALRGGKEFEFEVLQAIGGTEFGIISLPFLSLSDLHILDGQHRILGIHNGIRAIASELDKVTGLLNRLQKRKTPEDEEAAADLAASIQEAKDRIQELEEQRHRFDTERIAIQLFVEADPVAYSQMFYDTSENALGLPSSVKVRYDTRKVLNRVLVQVLDHPLLRGRTDFEADRLGRQNPNLLSAKHVAEIVRTLAVGIGGRLGRRVEESLDEADLLRNSMAFFDALSGFSQLEGVKNGVLEAGELRNHSMVASPVMLRVLAGVFNALRKENYSESWIRKYFSELDWHLSHPANKEWVSVTGGDLFFVGGLSPTSRRQDIVELTQLMVEWAKHRPDWLTTVHPSR